MLCYTFEYGQLLLFPVLISLLLLLPPIWVFEMLLQNVMAHYVLVYVILYYNMYNIY